MDVTETTSLSFNSVATEFGPGGAYEGFRFAVEGDVQTLFQNAGLQITTGNQFDAAGLSAAQAFLALFGEIKTVMSPSQTQHQSLVMYDGPGVQGFDTPVAYVQWFDSFNPAYDVRLDAGTWDENLPSVDVGMFLVREATVVPVPSALALMASALAGVGFAGRRRLMT